MRKTRKINVLMAGGSCTGKSTTAAELFSQLKFAGHDYDLITEMARKIRAEGRFGNYRSAYERIFFWEMQEREELCSAAKDGFITCSPLFQIYLQALFSGKEERDKAAIALLHNKCLEVRDRYHVIAIAADPEETPYKKDYIRKTPKHRARKKHQLVHAFCEQHFPDKIVYVKGSPSERAKMIIHKIDELRKKNRKKS